MPEYFTSKIDETATFIMKRIRTPMTTLLMDIVPGEQKPLQYLSVDEVGDIIDSMGYTQTRNMFRFHGVDGKTLQNCSSVDDLQEFGVASREQAETIFRKVQEEFNTQGVSRSILKSTTVVQSEGISKRLERINGLIFTLCF
jgi:hypothetical protein